MAPSARRVAGALLTALLAGLLALASAVLVASPSYAEDGYRYWNYSHLKGDTFEFAQTGPGDFTPKDGDVEGWRFGTSTVSTGIAPRADLAEVNFDSVCGDEEAAAGEKRVAVLVDYGDEADADGAQVPEPRAECAVVPDDASGQQTLESVADVRADGALICALDGYPAQGCGEPVKNAQVQADEAAVSFVVPAAATEQQSDQAGATGDNPAQAAEADDGSVSPALLGVLALVVALAAVALVMYRRNHES